MAGEWRNIPAMFFDWAARKGDAPWLWGKHAIPRDVVSAGGHVWRPITWAEAAKTVRALTKSLRVLGIEPGDRVAIVSENRPEWVLADIAILAAGAITVPAYTTYTTEDHRHVLADSGAKLVILSTAALAQRVLPAADQLTDIAAIISMEPLKVQTGADTYTWEAALALGEDSADTTDATVAAIDPDDTACLIYTSGTGGVPKGVMLTHGNMMSNAKGAYGVLKSAFSLDQEVFLSFLPLTHSYEHTAGFVFPLSIGAETYFTQPDQLSGDMVEVRPTIMTAMPRLCEVLQKRILSAIERTPGWRQALFRETLRLGIKHHERPGSLSFIERLADRVLDKLVRDKIRARFGGRLKALVSGGAPLNRDIGLFFLALGVGLIQGYGQTESGPVVGVNPPGRVKVDTVGPPLDGIEVMIAADGEILVRGPNVMKGYWRDPEATARTIRDGWLHTGDVGELDADGYLKITDRKRDFIKNSGGDMVSPQRVEGFLTLQPGIGQAMVHGDRRPFIVALIVPDDETLARHRGDGKASQDPAVQKRISEAVAATNRQLTAPERIRRHVVIDEPFTVTNGQMTPTLKIKRHVIREIYGPMLEGLYEAKGA